MTPQIPQISKVLLLVLYFYFQNVLEFYNEQLKKQKLFKALHYAKSCILLNQTDFPCKF